VCVCVCVCKLALMHYHLQSFEGCTMHLFEHNLKDCIQDTHYSHYNLTHLLKLIVLGQ
jgi:hypothetical protein